MEFLKKLYENKDVRTACWSIVDSSIIILLVILADLNAAWVPPLTAGLLFFTKYINKKYLTK